MEITAYLDYQASTPVDPLVVTEMLPYLQDNFGNPHSSDHVFGWRASGVVEKSRQEVASFIGADTDEIIFTSGATESNNLALQGCVKKLPNNKKILISAIEHKCVIECTRRLTELYGADVKFIPVNRDGVVSVDFIESELKKDIGYGLISVMAVNNEVGSIQPIKEIGRLAREHGALFHCDAAQALSTLNIDVFDDNIDLLSISGHKIYGPQGIGALYVRREIQKIIEPQILGGGQQVGLRSGTVPVFLCVGLSAALNVLRKRTADGERNIVSAKRNRLVEGIIEGGLTAHLNGPPLTMRHHGNANILFDGYHNHDIIAALQPIVAASTGSACSSGIPEPSYVLRAIGLTHEEASSSIRFSIGRFTTNEEIDIAINAVKEAIGQLSI